MNIAWWLGHASRENPAGTACIDADETVHTYSQLEEQSRRLATVLESEGVSEGDVVVTMLPESGLHMSIMFATLRLGAVFTAFNAGLKTSKLAGDATRCEASYFITDTAHLGLARELAGEGSGAGTVLTAGGGSADDLLARAATADPYLGVTPRANDDAAVLNFTAGTSGDAKGVIFTHGTLQTSALGAVFTSELGRDTANLSVIGMHHSGGLHDVVKFVIAQGTILWAGGWNPDGVVQKIRKHRPNWIFFIVPTMVRDLMRHEAWPELDLAGVGMYVAGEPVPDDVARALQDKQARFCNAYGMTETMPFRITGPQGGIAGHEYAPRGSSGRPNREFCEVVLKDPDSGDRITTPGEPGEICVRGDIVTPGYINDPQRTNSVFDSEGFMWTRDLATFDQNGWFYLRGRTDDVINCGGEKVSLVEIDNVLLAHDSVLDAACIGVPHERFGVVPGAFVKWREQTLEQDKAVAVLDEFVSQRIERWKRPRLYVFVDEVPRTETKRSKALAAMRSMVDDIRLSVDDGVTSLARLRSGEPL